MSIFDSFLLYIVVYLISSALVYAGYKYEDKKLRAILLFCGILVPTLLAGLRYGVGTDFFAYENRYKYYIQMNFAEMFALRGWLNSWTIWAISKIAYLFGGVSVFFGLYAFFTYFFFVLALKEYKNLNLFFVTFGFLMSHFTSGFNTMRQALAVSIIFWGLKYVYKQNFSKYFIVVLFATATHTTALIALPIYFLYSDNNTKKIWNIKSVAAVVIAFIGAFSVAKLASLLGDIELFGLSHYEMYTKEVTGNNYTFLLLLLILGFVFLFQQEFVGADQKYRLLIVLFTIGVCLELSGYFSAYVKRIGDYFNNIIDVVLIFQIPLFFKEKSRGIAYILGFMYVVLLFLGLYVILGQANIVPYRIR